MLLLALLVAVCFFSYAVLLLLVRSVVATLAINELRFKVSIAEYKRRRFSCLLVLCLVELTALIYCFVLLLSWLIYSLCCFLRYSFAIKLFNNSTVVADLTQI